MRRKHNHRDGAAGGGSGGSRRFARRLKTTEEEGCGSVRFDADQQSLKGGDQRQLEEAVSEWREQLGCARHVGLGQAFTLRSIMTAAVPCTGGET